MPVFAKSAVITCFYHILYTFELKMKRKLGFIQDQDSSAKKLSFPLKPSVQWQRCVREFECNSTCWSCERFLSLSAEAQGELWERYQMRREANWSEGPERRKWEESQMKRKQLRLLYISGKFQSILKAFVAIRLMK